MKKLFGLAGLVLFFGTLSVNAQSNRSRVNSSETPAQSETGGVTATAASIKMARAERDFTRNYKNASGAEWYETYDGGSVVYFSEGDSKMKSVYNKRGNWKYTLRFLDVKQMDIDTKRMVKSIYFDYEISRAIEVQNFEKKVLLVYLENETSLKTARIFDGEVETVESYKKSK